MHAWVFFVCLVLMAAMRGLVQYRFGLYESNVNRWVFGGIYSGPLGRVEDGLVQGNSMPVMINVTEDDGAIVVWTEEDAGDKAAERTQKSVTLLSWSGTYQTGFWSPTRWHKAHLLFDSSEYGGTIVDWSVNPPTQRQLEIQAAVVADQNFDPRLVATQHVEETGIIWLGYLMNALWLAMGAGMGWWCWWLPTRIRDRRAQKRRARNLCPVCTYDVRATPSRCPECGWGQEGQTQEANAE